MMPDHNPVEEIVDGIMETINDHIPKNKSVRFFDDDNKNKTPISAQMNKFNKLLGRHNTIHAAFGGGKSADVILWRNKKISSGIMVAATAIWVLFELLGYHFLPLACFSLVIGMVIQFVWSNASYLMNSPTSSVPRLVLPRDLFANVGACLDTEVNRFLCFLQDITSGKDLKHFVLVVGALWAAAVIGSYCNFVTVVYIGFVAAHTLPVFYEKYEETTYFQPKILTGAINSETLIGRFIKEKQQTDESMEVSVATKFAALPWRLGRQSVLSALKDSLSRLGLSSVDLYQLHWPGIWGNQGYIDGLGDAVEKGLVKAVGVSNYSERRLRDAHKQLQIRGIPLASNQVNYSLIYRIPEQNGVKSTCDELGITLIAYSPIAQGVLTGKYSPENIPDGPRSQIYTQEFLTKLQPLMSRIKEIGPCHGKTNTQVALNWLISQENVVPIPGAKTEEQAREFVGALGWRLTDVEVEELRSLSSEIKSVIEFPVEKM